MQPTVLDIKQDMYGLQIRTNTNTHTSRNLWYTLVGLKTDTVNCMTTWNTVGANSWHKGRGGMTTEKIQIRVLLREREEDRKAESSGRTRREVEMSGCKWTENEAQGISEKSRDELSPFQGLFLSLKAKS